MRVPVCVVLVCLGALAAAEAFAQSGSDNGRKQAQAVRVPNGSIRVDGRVDERVWSDVPPLTDFVQREPVEGATPTDRMEVRFAYDDNALYVGARMASSDPIQAPLGRRDDSEQAEHFFVSLDTYLNRRTASSFGVTAAGVRLDEFFSRDEQWDAETGFDPVWEAQTSIDADGWTAELWIPFSQLRFNDRDQQVWGLNIQRWVPTRNEEVYWSLVRRTDEGWASRFGDLHGISGIRPSRRLELLPYVASSSHLVGVREAGDPFSGGSNLESRIGMDAKVGLGSNLTLEATVNPDFGQVEADPAEVNLSAFETFFSERRPFFTEGAEMLTGNINNYFYSRRIGASPPGSPDADFVEMPGTTTILGAAKLTGRLQSGTSIGMLGAVTDDEYARTFSTPSLFGRERVAPTTAYGVARVQQEFGPPGSTIAAMATAVHRNLQDTDPLASRVVNNAFTVSTDSIMRLWDGNYELQWASGMTHVNGAAGAIDRLQRASARYLQRPDADYVNYDPRRTTMTGMRSSASIQRRNSRHWSWEASTTIESPEFESNDIGRLTSGDGLQFAGEIEYQETTPGRWWREYAFSVGQDNEWNWGGAQQRRELNLGYAMTWLNFWESSLDVSFFGRNQDMRLTRGGPLMETPRGWGASLEIESAAGAETQGDFATEYRQDEDGGLLFNLEGDITMRPGPRWQVTIGPSYEREVNTQQFVTALSGGGPATFGSRYIFGNIDRSTWATELRVNYTFKPDLTLDFYGEPFAASGTYMRFGELAAAGTRALLDVDPATLRNRDFNVMSFRSNLVLRWEWRAGSTLYLVWQQDREEEETLRSRVGVRDMFSSFGTAGDNFFAIKMSYWFSPN